MPKTILYIHQSSELYGSDKALYYLVNKINLNPDFNAIVILPEKGPLKNLLEKNNIRVIVFPVIKVSRNFFKLKKIITLPFLIAKTTKKLRKILEDENIDIIHSNTLAVLLGAFYSKRYKLKHVWHVHEIIKKPKIVSVFYPLLVGNFSNKVVYNSRASKEFLSKNNNKLIGKSVINLNGMDRTEPIISVSNQNKIRKQLFDAKESDIVMALVGRISKWKGQKLLLNSFNELREKHNNLKLVFVGSAPPNQEYLVDELQSQIDNYNLNDSCKIIPFQENIWSIWDSIDFAVVPSTEPEPFGLVALEAMLAKIPVIAASHGGLKEIVLDNHTGYFFSPNNSEALCTSIEKLIANKDNLDYFGINGFNRATSHFSIKRHVEKFIEIYDSV
ncbi:glycosyltransferase family 4 protein [Winogradskyella sp. PG-2]|uniref:glycosyltransferase family 4 protein n=1 Tax=Winogradskyella sp. PG-2 TaxID=754409 RepID=UPI0004589735|nr:glycosyltransferase family 4 protein [Winogradskyella sp. PG-2]BAO75581.1 glycosyltransferase [Winogradskyella sp. PG-2]